MFFMFSWIDSDKNTIKQRNLNEANRL